jgi:uncharacterized protein
MTSPPSYPGVYVSEAPGGARPVEALGTSTPAFVGLTELGDAGVATRVTSWTEYQRLFGSAVADSYLAQSVYHFFGNGGRQCYVVRAGDPGVAASTVVRNEAGQNGVRFSARHPGTAGNALVLVLEKASSDPGSGLKVSVGREVASGGPGSPSLTEILEIYDDLSMDPRSPSYLETVLASSTTVRVTVLDLSTTQLGSLTGGRAPVLPLEDGDEDDEDEPQRHGVVSLNLNLDGWREIQLGEDARTTTDPGVVAADIQAQVQDLSPLKASTPDQTYAEFTCAAEDGVLRLTSGALTATSGPVVSSVDIRAFEQDAVALLGLLAADGAISRGPYAARRPHPDLRRVHVGDEPAGQHVGTVVPGTAGSRPSRPDYTEAFSALDALTDVSLLAVPGEGSLDVLDQGLRYCAGRPLQDMFFVGEMSRDHDTVEEAKDFVGRATKSSYGAVYFPWVLAGDPAGTGTEPVPLPPSGFVCGLYGRTDASHGVWKAPAGTGATVFGALGLTVELADLDHGVLNLKAVNVVRRFPTAGTVAFGARTLAVEPEWRYVPVRRTAIMLRTSIYHGIQWAVFEPNDETLWAQLRLAIRSFMTGLFRQGAFQGATPDDAFFVKCDGETTTPDDIDSGIVRVQVGFAPLKPAEFVLVTISQQAGQAA